jgi:hypothetical protein
VPHLWSYCLYLAGVVAVSCIASQDAEAQSGRTPMRVDPVKTERQLVTRREMLEEQSASATPVAGQCAQHFHNSLQAIGRQKAAALRAGQAAARRHEDSWPGRWLNWDPRKAALRRKLERAGFTGSVIVAEDQICVQAVMGGGGRVRCLKWEPKPENYVPPKPVPKPDEPPPPPPRTLEMLRETLQFVRLRGRLPGLERNMPEDHLTRRMGEELLGFLRQRFNENLCAGTPAMLTFYRREFSEFGGSMHKAVRTARESFDEAVALLDLPKPSNRRGPKSSEAAPQAPNAADLRPITDVSAALKRLILVIAERHLTRERFATVEKASSPIAMLAALTDSLEQDVAASRELSVYDQHRRTAQMRAVELAFYADRQARKYVGLAGLLEQIMLDIEDAHRQTCICR